MHRFVHAALLVSAATLAAALAGAAQEPERIAGGGGVELAVYEGGNPTGAPIVFIHGFLGSHLNWLPQFTGALAEEFRLVAFDLRGHGASKKPDGPVPYTDGLAWAEDMAAVMRAKDLDRPVLVGWSYGGFVIADYLREHGDEEVAGIVIVAATSALGTEEAASLLGDEVPHLIGEVLSPDVATSVDATRRFLRLVTADPMPEDLFQTTLAVAMMVPPHVRQGMFSRSFDNADLFRRVTVPVLVIHGKEDRIVRPRAAELIAESAPDARLLLLDGVGHAPFLEDPRRFDAELAAFVGRVREEATR